MDSLSIPRNLKNKGSFTVPVLVKRTNKGDFQATVPDIPKFKNNGYMEVPLIDYGNTRNYAVRGISNKISQWLYELIDDGKPIPKFSTLEEAKIKAFSDPRCDDTYEVIELLFTEEEILNIA